MAAEPCRIVVVGMMGSGKSTVGRLLAERLGWPYHDNDQLLVEGEGGTARELLAERGDDGLLAAEAAALTRALALPVPCIVGVAARAILDPGAREALRGAGLVAWLRVTPETVRQRAAGAAHRPWPAGDPLAWLRAAVHERDPLYASVADLTLDAEVQSPGQLAATVVTVVTERGCGDATPGGRVGSWPMDRQALLDRYRAGTAAVEAAAAGLDDAALDRRAADGSWSAREVLHHLADSEARAFIRLRRLIAEDRPELLGYDEPEYARRLHYDRPVASSVAVVRAVRAASLELLEALTPDEWERRGTHTESGSYAVADWLRIYAEHPHEHVAQLRAAVAGSAT